MDKKCGYGILCSEKNFRLECGAYKNGLFINTCPVPRVALPIDSQILTKEERMANLIYPNGDYYLGPLNDTYQPHGHGGKLYSSTHICLFAGDWLNGVMQNPLEISGSSRIMVAES